jgi:hypothetical protein
MAAEATPDPNAEHIHSLGVDSDRMIKASGQPSSLLSKRVVSTGSTALTFWIKHAVSTQRRLLRSGAVCPPFGQAEINNVLVQLHRRRRITDAGALLDIIVHLAVRLRQIEEKCLE